MTKPTTKRRTAHISDRVAASLARIKQLRPTYYAALNSADIDPDRTHSESDIIRAALHMYESHIQTVLSRQQPTNGQLFEK